MLAGKTSQCGINLDEAVGDATRVFLVCSQKQGEAGFVMWMPVNEDRNQNR